MVLQLVITRYLCGTRSASLHHRFWRVQKLLATGSFWRKAAVHGRVRSSGWNGSGISGSLGSLMT